MRYFLSILYCWLCVWQVSAQTTKYQKWLQPSFFRGFNTEGYYNQQSRLFILRDILDVRKNGANVVQIQTDGFYYSGYPYQPNQNAIDNTDNMVQYCQRTRMYYTISVLSGPGLPRPNLIQPATIWNNFKEQVMYADMVADIALRYGSDTLFVGLDMINEPAPLYGEPPAITPFDLQNIFLAKSIDIGRLYHFCIQTVRQNVYDLPLLVQCAPWADADFTALAQKQHDNYIVYNFHLWQPRKLSRQTSPYKASYPGTYFSNKLQDSIEVDSMYLRNFVVSPIRDFQITTGNKPILIGAMGIANMQFGGDEYLRQLGNFALEQGWHFMFSDWRNDKYYNYELMSDAYIDAIKSNMHEVQDSVILSDSVELMVYPNPVRSDFTVSVRVRVPETLNIVIYDFNGRTVYNVARNYPFSIGKHEFSIQGSAFPNGIYFVRALRGTLRVALTSFVVQR